MKAPPAFQFYVSDWLSSTSIALMTAYEERGYLRLLAHQWANDDCSLPNNRKVLLRLALLRREAELDTVLKQFEPHPDRPDKIINRKLFEQRRVLDQFRAERAASGRKGAQKKYGAPVSSAYSSAPRSADGSAYSSALALQSSSSIFNSPPPTPPQREGREKEAQLREKPRRMAGTSETRIGRGTEEAKPPDNDTLKLRELWERYGSQPNARDLVAKEYNAWKAERLEETG
jgi:hypothetical protein